MDIATTRDNLKEGDVVDSNARARKTKDRRCSRSTRTASLDTGKYSHDQLFRTGPKCRGIGIQCALVTLYLGLLSSGVSAGAGKVVESVGPCSVKVDGRLINLNSLQSTDGTPRFGVEWRGWNYSFNPCTSFNLPTNPHHGLGDQCPFVSLCKWKLSRDQGDAGEYYTMGIQSTAKFHTKLKMYQRYRKQVEARLEEEKGGDGEEEEEEEEEEESEEDEDSSSTSEESEEEEDYDYQYLFEDYKEVPEIEKDESVSENSTTLDNISNPPISGTNRIDLSENKTTSFMEYNTSTLANDPLEETQDINRTRVARDSPVVKGTPKEISGETSSKMIKPTSESSKQTTTKFFFELYDDYEQTNDNNNDAGDSHTQQLDKEPDTSETGKTNDKKLNDEDGEELVDSQYEPPEPQYEFRAHESPAHRPYLEYRDFVPVVREDSVLLTYRGVKTMRRRRAHIMLTCDFRKRKAEDATFSLIAARGLNLYFELRHRCCCPDACLMPRYIPESFTDDNITDPYANDTAPISRHGAGEEAVVAGASGAQFLWLVLVVNGSILACAILIAGMCCRKGGSGQYTSMLPVLPSRESPIIPRKALHSSQMTIHSMDSHYFTSTKLTATPEFLDYSSAASRRQQQPVAEDGVIDSRDLDVGQRLGGGLFGDTYVAELKERPVAAKRITVGVHQNQLTDADYEWITQQVVYLSKQRHKYLVSVLGICTNTRQPYIVTEFVQGDSLKDLLLREEEDLTWHRKIRICIQVSDAMAFLHSAKFPILHRDLRCANILTEPAKDRIKVVDYGIVKIVQRLRQQCTGRAGCYCQKELSALPATIRWSAPEVLYQPTTDEYHSDVLCPATDVYSMGMVLWEVAVAQDPFHHIADDAEVMELVKAGERPGIDSVPDVLPHYKALMKACWQQEPDDRPSFKQVATNLKNIGHMLNKMSSHRRTRQRSETTSILRSALNILTDS